MLRFERVWDLVTCTLFRSARRSAVRALRQPEPGKAQTRSANWWPDLTAKAAKLHEALARELKQQHGKIKLHPQWQLRVITTARDPPAAPPQQSWPGQLATIDRSSFKLEPWSNMLFDDFTTDSR